MQKEIFAELRRQGIAKYVRERGQATVEELCEHFSVSPATVRTDLKTLDRSGALQRTHGGAIRSKYSEDIELTNQEKETQNVEQKQAIAKIALEFIHPGDAIILDTGTTTYELANLLMSFSDLTVVTNDLKICGILESNERITVCLLGGQVRSNYHCTYGPTTAEELNTIYSDTAFIATNGLSLTRGLSTASIEMAAIKHRMIEASKKVIVLADSSKIGKEAYSAFAPISKVDILITDTKPGDDFIKELKSMETHIMTP